MKTTKTLAFALALALGATASVGCAGSEVDDTIDDGDPTNPDDPDDVIPTSAEGKYALTSEFDVASGLPGTVGNIVNTFIELTDDDDDPAGGLLDLAINQVSNSTLRNILQGARVVLAGTINDRILEIAPDFVPRIIELGDNFGQLARDFGTLTTLDVRKAGASYAATHTLTGVQFKIDGQAYAFPFADYGMDDVVTQNVSVALETTGKFTVASHQLPISMGKVLRLGMDELLIPAIDPLATDLGDMLDGLVDCSAMGQAMYDAVDIGSPSTYASACEIGLQALANLAYQQLNDLDQSAMNFGIAGQARATDSNGDKKIDQLQRGEWAGQVEYAGTPAPLQSSTFAGSRM